MNELHEIIRVLLESVDRRYEMLEDRYNSRTRDIEKRMDRIENQYEEEFYRLNQEIRFLQERIHDVETQLLFMQNSENLPNSNRKRF
jgi:predicted  nucleic acid-binding Zn-ribbon protein